MISDRLSNPSRVPSQLGPSDSRADDETFLTSGSAWLNQSARGLSVAVLAISLALIVLVGSPRAAQASDLVAQPAGAVTQTVAATDFGQRIVEIAKRYLGYRYTWGGISPSTGFDCSGFTYYVYKAAGKPISRALYYQRWTGTWVSRSSLRAGDLVFFKNTYRTGLSHVGIYIGGGNFIHARSERYGISISSLNTYYWTTHYLTARRP